MIRIFDLEKTDVESILKRAIVWRSDVEQTVKGIMEDVKTRGDEALYEYTERFDGVKLSSLRVSEEEIKNAVESVDPMFLETLKKARNMPNPATLTEVIEYADMVVKYVSDGSGTKDMIQNAKERLEKAMNQ